MPANSSLAKPLIYAFSLLLVACGGSSSSSKNSPASEQVNRFVDAERAQCMRDSEYLNVGEGIDAPSKTLAITPAAAGTATGKPTGSCADNNEYRFGSGIHDITGPVANTSGMGWESPTQVLSGLHQRQYARAFAIESPCNGKRVLFMSTDTGMVFGSMRQAVLREVAQDPELSQHYGPDNIMLSATHTHQGPAGYSHYEGFNTFHFGFDKLVLDTIVDGMMAALRMAHQNIQAHPETAPIQLAVDELLNTNINRSLIAFEQNSQQEREEFINTRGEEITVDKRVVQLNMVRKSGSAVGVINWFGVHPTVLGSELDLVSSDIKGYASLGFERIMNTRYGETGNGEDNFVAAFAQKDEGDASPNIFIVERPHPDPTRGGGADPYESNAISGTKQLAKALDLFQTGKALNGPIDYRFFHVKMDEVSVTDPAVLNALNHPAKLDAEEIRTCLAAVGPAFGAGAEDGPGFTREGISCDSDPDLIAAALSDIATATQGLIPPTLLSNAVLCNLDQLPLLDLSCHAEKPILIPLGPPLSAEPSIVPFQLFRMGNLAILGIPWEVTTMSARRIQKQLFPLLAPVGIDTIVVAGLVNEYSHYLTTREEYSVQQYEGGSTIFGPWSLAAVEQESRRLARSLAEGQASPEGPSYVDGSPILIRLPYIPSDLPGLGKSYGDVVTDAPSSAAPGDTVTASFQAGHPRNDLKIQSSYVYAERLGEDQQWQVVATDKDPELLFSWQPLLPSPLPIELPEVGPSTAEVTWHIPRNTPAGTYRLRHEGAAQTLVLPKQTYSGVSSSFTISEPISNCP